MRTPTILIAAVALLASSGLGGCASTPRPVIQVEYRDVYKETQRPCPAERPARPKKLERPLPVDPARLVDLLLAKLLEYSGPGGYADRADAALAICTSETSSVKR